MLVGIFKSQKGIFLILLEVYNKTSDLFFKCIAVTKRLV